MVLSSISTFCRDLSPLLQIVGYLLLIFKVFLPLILIVVIFFDLIKAVFSNKPDETKKHLKNCAFKLALGVLVFFVPTICMIVMSFVGQYETLKNSSGLDYDVCYDCMFNPSSNNCSQATELAKYK